MGGLQVQVRRGARMRVLLYDELAPNPANQLLSGGKTLPRRDTRKLAPR